MKKFNNKKLILGTAQFGFDYGINNQNGRICKKEVFRILKYAKLRGINTLDTAYGYGKSEKVIGDFIRQSSFNFKIISKSSFKSSTELKSAVLKSLKKLSLKKLYGYLIHNFDFYLKNKKVFKVLKYFQKKGKIKKIGFSLYFPEELDYLLKNKINFDIVQLPYSFFDQRFAPYFKKLKKKGIEIHVRSVFLQGLIFKKPENLGRNFLKVKRKLITLKKLAEKTNAPINVLAINFAVLNEKIDKMVVGVDNIEQLESNLMALQYKKKVKNVYLRLKKLKEDDLNIILPFKWEG